MHVEVILTPAEIALLSQRDLRASTCVVFDVLRATSTIITAFANGARRIFPVATIDEARRLHRESLPEALLGGERGGQRIEGFQLGNSPLEYTRGVVADRDIVTTTTNGTVALRACAGAGEVIAGAWLNIAALAAFLLAREQTPAHLLLVCAGTENCFALEDGLAAGALLSRLMVITPSKIACNDASLAMLALFEQHRETPLAAMQDSKNGKRLVQLGLGTDVAWCAQTDALQWVASLQDGALIGISVSAGICV